MLEYTKDVTDKFRLSNCIRDNFNLKIIMSVRARHLKEIFDLRGIDVEIDSIYNSLIKDFCNSMSIDYYFGNP